MAKLGGAVVSALACAGRGGVHHDHGTRPGWRAGGIGTAARRRAAGMMAAQGAAYCSKLTQTYAEYVGTVGGYLGGSTTGGQATDLDARVAIAQCQDGNYASGIPVLQRKLRDARVTVPPPPPAG